MDNPPPDITQGGVIEKIRTLSGIKDLIKVGFQNRLVFNIFYSLITFI